MQAVSSSLSQQKMGDDYARAQRIRNRISKYTNDGQNRVSLK